MLPKSNPINRQNSSPHIGRTTSRKLPASRSKTPPAKFETPKNPNVAKTGNFQPLQPITLPRTGQKKVVTPSENSSKSSSCKSTAITPELSKDFLMDMKYNLYCQANLMVLHSKLVRDGNEAKMIQEMENLEMSLLEMDEKMMALSTDLEKVRFFKKVRNNLQDKIESYEKITSK